MSRSRARWILLAVAGVGVVAVGRLGLGSARRSDVSDASASAFARAEETAGERRTSGDSRADEETELEGVFAPQERREAPADFDSRAGGLVSVDALAPASASDPTGPPATWSGHVLEEGSNRPVEGARVVLMQGERTAEASTDAEGAFTLLWPAGLAADLAVIHPAFVDLHAVNADLARDARLFVAHSARLTGRVEPWPPPGLASGGEQVPEAILWARESKSRSKEAQRLVALDADGRFAFADLAPGAWNVSVRAPGALIETLGGIELASGAEREVVLAARAGGVLRGRVITESEREPLAGVRITARALRRALPPGAERSFDASSTSGADGRVELRGLAAGPHRIELELPWDARERVEVHVPEDLGVLEHTFEVAEPASLAGVVVDARGDPVAGARLIVLPAGDRAALEAALGGGATGRPAAQSDPEGRFTIDRVPAGERLVVLAQARAEPALPPGSTQVGPLEPGSAQSDVRIALPRCAAVRGRVLGEHGLGLGGAEVVLRAVHAGASAAVSETVADAQGAFAFDEVPAGDVIVEAAASGYRTARERVELAPEATVEVALALGRAFIVEGSARDERGAGVSGIAVELEIAAGSPEALELESAGGKGMRYVAFTDPYGRFRFDRLSAGRWEVSIRSGDWELVACDPPSVDPALGLPLLLELRALPRVELAGVVGEVWTSDGGALVDLAIRGLGRGSVLSTDGARFEARGVDPGRRHVTVEARGYVPERRGPLEILPGATADLGRIDLLPGTELRVRVRDKAGKAIEHCQVQLRPVAPEKGGAKRGNRAWKLERRGKGLYGLDAVPRGKWRLRVVHPGYRTHSAPVDVREKAAGELVVILEPA